jgi:Mn-dependent DtxR family transcriptional regulator
MKSFNHATIPHPPIHVNNTKKQEPNMDQKLSELTLLLIYLTDWEETPKTSSKGKTVFRAFKGYRYEELKELETRGLIRLTPGGKYLTVTEKGKQAAEELKNHL